MHSYLITGLRAGPFFTLLCRHGFSPAIKNFQGLLFAMHNAFWSSFFSWREKSNYAEQIQSWPVPDDPVIIVGHWRTGSTFLHLLLGQDKQFVAPSVFQAAFPDCFLSAEKFYRPVMGRIIKKRPMDNVKLAFDDPQEDEFALLKMTLDSPLMDIIFPKKKGYFLLDHEDYNPSVEKRAIWKKNLHLFARKVTRDTGKILLLKNPLHSVRIPFLLEVFPNARFIHIHRHPYNVVASSVNLWRVMARDNQLKGKPYYPGIEEVAEGFSRFYAILERDLETVPENRKCRIAFEDLEIDPLGVSRRIYKELGLEFTPGSQRGLEAFLEKEKQFRKNSYTFGEKEKEFVYRKMKSYFDQYNYSENA